MVDELDLWLRRPSINYLNKGNSAVDVKLFHVCCPHCSGSVSLPRPFAHQEVDGCCKSLKLLAFSLPSPCCRIHCLIPQLWSLLHSSFQTRY